MAATARDLLPFDVWESGTNQNSIPANDNALRAEVIGAPASSFEATQPVSPVEGRLYILSAAWGDEVIGTLAYYQSSAWSYWNPYEGQIKEVGGIPYRFDSSEWVSYGLLSVASFATPAAAVAAALAASGELYWPAGDWAAAASIPDLHSVRHTGPGVIVRGSDRFAVDPDDANTNVLYVATTGSDSNDGLTAAQPFATLQAAFDAMANYGPMLRGTWEIEHAAGTYTEGALFPVGLRSRQEITIKGPDVGGTPNVPTAIIDGTSSTHRRGISGASYLRVVLKDIKVVNFSATDEAGVEFQQWCRVRLDNAHVDDCYYGWHFLDWCYYDAIGGIIENCTNGVLELFGVVRNFKAAGSTASQTLIQNCTEFGIKAKELCTGHLDYAKIDNCGVGVFLSRNSTANLSNCQIYNNDIGAVCQSSSSIVDTASVDWGAGTANANTVKFLMRGASSEVVRNGGEGAQTAPYIGLSEKKAGLDYTVVAHTGTTTRTQIYGSVIEAKAGDFQAEGTHIRCVIYGVATALSGTCIVELRTPGANVGTVTLPVGAAGSFIAELRLYVTGPGTQQHFSEARVNGANPVVASATRALNFTSADQALSVTATLSNSADTVTFRGVELYTPEA